MGKSDPRAHLDKHKIVKLKNIHVHVRVLSVGEVHTQVMPFYVYVQ